MKKCLKAVKKTFGKDFKNQLNQQNCEYMAEIGEIVYNYLIKHNKKYKKAVEMRRKLRGNSSQNDTVNSAEFINTVAYIDSENAKTHFLLGLKLGINLKP